MILISPWSRNTQEGKPSPKNYPHWEVVVSALVKAGHKVLQVSCTGEADIPGARRVNDLPLEEIGKLMKACMTWICVDNFFHHMAWTLKQPGVVIFGSSDPEIFGHPENINLLKDRRYLRARQFGLWSQDTHDPDKFVPPEDVVSAATRSIRQRKLDLRLV
jgi:ADP-heptose:LPS heptosyltransferase